MLSHGLRAARYAFLPQIYFGGGATSTTTQNSTTFTSLAIGPPSPNRRVIVCAYYREAFTYTADATCTVAGQSTSSIAVTGGTANPFLRMIAYITDAAVTSGTTANVVITVPVGETMTRCFVAAYSIVKETAIVLDQADASVAASNPSTQTSSITTDKVGLFFGLAGTSGSLSSLSLSGPVTTNYNTGIIGSASALATATITGGTGTCSATTTGTSSVARTILVTWS
jgi:hypothetical protein